MNDTNELGQPIGWPIPDWKTAELPTTDALKGRYCRLERLNAADHSDALFDAFSEDTSNKIWTYLPFGPFENGEEHHVWTLNAQASTDPYFFAIRDLERDRVTGYASLMRIKPAAGSIEVGSINYAPALQKTRAASEAMYLMMRHAFEDLGYRRYEWKCDALNAGSCKAARRLGFTFEGIFRQALVYKGRNRDTAWFSILNSEWPRLKSGYEHWLDPDNFNADGQQKRALSSLLNQND